MIKVGSFLLATLGIPGGDRHEDQEASVIPDPERRGTQSSTKPWNHSPGAP